MFYPELTDLTNDIQGIVDMSCRTNLTMRVADDIQKLTELIEELDPTDINFAKQGYFTKNKIARYWEKFNYLYTGLENAVETLQNRQRVLQNTIITLKNEKQKADNIIAQMQPRIADSTDMETAQQMAVVMQAMNTLTNLINEYNTCYEYITKVQSLTMSTFQQAINIARMQQDFSTFDFSAYVNNFKTVQRLLQK